jgi:hypothetical protein
VNALLPDRKTGGGVRIAQRLDALSADGATTDYRSGKKPYCCGLTLHGDSDQRTRCTPGSGDRGDLAALAWLWASVTFGVALCSGTCLHGSVPALLV